MLGMSLYYCYTFAMTEVWHGNDEEARQKQNESQFELVDGIKYELCSDAERFLYRSIGERGIALINGILLMKSVGAAVGLAIEEQEIIGGGVIQPGYWYQLADNDQKQAVRRIAHKGKETEKNLVLPNSVKLIEERKVRDRVNHIVDGEQLLEMAVEEAKKLALQPAQTLDLETILRYSR